MENTIIERIRVILKRENTSQKKLSELSTLSLHTINSVLSRGSNPSAIFLSKLIESFPQYSANWILTGSGDMLMPPTYGNIGEVAKELKELQKIDEDKKLDVAALIKVNDKYFSAFTMKELGNILNTIKETYKL